MQIIQSAIVLSKFYSRAVNNICPLYIHRYLHLIFRKKSSKMPPKKRGTRATKRKAEPVDEQPLEGENEQDEVSC